MDSTAGVAASFTNATAGQRPLLRADGLEFDGVDDNLSYPDDPALRFGLTNFTIAFAFRANNLTGDSSIVDKRGTGPAGTVPGWGVIRSASFIKIAFDVPGGSNNLYTVSPINTVIAGVWLYGLVKIDRTAGVASSRINGASALQVPIPAGDISGTRDLAIGISPNTGLRQFNGLIGRLLVIDKLLDAADTDLIEGWLQGGFS